MSGLEIPTIALPVDAPARQKTPQRLSGLKNAFPKMYMTHALAITTSDPLSAVASTTQLAKELGMSLQELSLRRYRQAEPVVSLRLKCGDACIVDTLVNNIRNQQCISHVLVEHLLTGPSNL